MDHTKQMTTAIQTADKKILMEDTSGLNGMGGIFEQMMPATWTADKKFWMGDPRRLNCQKKISRGWCKTIQIA